MFNKIHNFLSALSFALLQLTGMAFLLYLISYFLSEVVKTFK